MKQFLLLLVVGLLVAGTGIVVGLPDPPTPGVGNIPTYSGNGNGEVTAEIMQSCAFAAVEVMKNNPGADGDELFKLCYGTINGVRSI